MKTVSKIVMYLGFAAFAVTASAADVLTGKNGMTLYTFDKDSGGKSACAGQCATLWPPAQVKDATGKDFGDITRADGSKQLSYQGKPVYYYINDSKAGDATGDNVNNVWHVVPKGNTKKSESSYGSGSSY